MDELLVDSRRRSLRLRARLNGRANGSGNLGEIMTHKHFLFVG
jgi:hypothetical protein